MRFHAPDALNMLFHMLMQEESYDRFCFEVSKQYRSVTVLLYDIDIAGKKNKEWSNYFINFDLFFLLEMEKGFSLHFFWESNL